MERWISGGGGEPGELGRSGVKGDMEEWPMAEMVMIGGAYTLWMDN